MNFNDFNECDEEVFVCLLFLVEQFPLMFASPHRYPEKLIIAFRLQCLSKVTYEKVRDKNVNSTKL